MKDLLSFCWKSVADRSLLVRYVLCCLLQALLAVATPFLVGDVINLLVSGAPVVGAALLCGLVTVLGGSAAVVSYRGTLLYTLLQADSSFRLDLDATRHIQRLPASFFQGFDAGFWRKRLNADTNDLTIFFLQSVTGLLENGASLLLSLGVLLAVDWRIALACAGLAVATEGMYAVFADRIHAASSEFQDDLSRGAACMLAQLRDVAFIRRHALFGWSEERMRESYGPVRESMYRLNRTGARYTLASDLVRAAAVGLTLWVAAAEAAAGRMEVGYVATAYGYLTTMTEAVRYLAGFGYSYQSARVNYGHLRDLADVPEEPRGEAAPAHVGQVSVEGLCYSHPGSDRVLFGGLTRTFERGRVYGVAGPNGCGKSTLLDVLAGMVPGTHGGTMSYDGAPLGSLDQYALRAGPVAFVEQDPIMVEGTLLENLHLLAPQADRDEAVTLCRKAGLGALVKGDGLDRPLRSGDGGLSGGERQKVAVVRALLKHPDLLPMDEPTAALDTDGRRDFAALLERLRPGRIVMVVTHDEELLALCDEVVRLEGQEAHT